MNHIIALVDFTRVSESAIAQAGKIARAADSKLTLLHIAEEDKRSDESELISELNVAAEVLGNKALKLELHVEYGNFQERISEVLDALGTDLVVVGTHGIRGKQRNLFSRNIAKLLQNLSKPTLVVQGQREQAASDLGKWMLINVADDQIAEMAWLKDSHNSKLNSISSTQDQDELEAKAYEIDANLIVQHRDSEAGLNMVLNTYGIPVLLL